MRFNLKGIPVRYRNESHLHFHHFYALKKAHINFKKAKLWNASCVLQFFERMF